MLIHDHELIYMPISSLNWNIHYETFAIVLVQFNSKLKKL